MFFGGWSAVGGPRAEAGEADGATPRAALSASPEAWGAPG